MAAPSCSVCDHPQRHLIEAAMATGEPLRQIAARFGVSRSSLSRHKDHVALQGGAVPARGTPALDPEPPVPALPPVAQCEAHLSQLQTRLAACQGALVTAQGQREAAHAHYRQAVWKDDAFWTGNAQHQLQHVQERLEDLTALQTILEDGIREAESALEAARTRRTALERAHWQRLATTLSDPLERWVCRLAAHERGPAPSPPVLAPHEQWKARKHRPMLAQRLRE